MVNDVHKAVSCRNVRLNNCCINSAAFDRNRFIVAMIQNIKVEELLVDMRWNLNDLNVVKGKKGFSLIIYDPNKFTPDSTYLILTRAYLIRTVTVVDEMQIQDFPHLLFVAIKHSGKMNGMR